jgi:hypothetical protein
MLRYSRLTAIAAALMLLLCTMGLYAQGFKTTFGPEITMTLKRKLAAYVNINKKRIRIDATTQGNVPSELAEILKTKFQTEIQKDTNFVIDQNNPETILTFAVNGYYADYVQGSRQEGQAYVSYTKVSGNLQVSYTATEFRTNAPIDSENLEADLKGVFPPPTKASDSGVMGKLFGILPGGDRDYIDIKDLTLNRAKGVSTDLPTKNELSKLLVGEIVKRMAQRSIPVEEQFPVFLPKGKLERLSKLALTGGSWGKVLNEVEMMPQFPKPGDEAYRIYLIGLANEALSYEQTSKEETRKYLFEARKHYENAKNMKLNEEHFMEPYTRVDKALIQYDRIIRQEKDYQEYRKVTEQKESAKRATTPSGSTGRDSNQSGDPCDPMPTVWNNQMIICMFKQGTVSEELIALIQSESSPRFDATSTEGTLQLKNAGIPLKVILAIRARMAGINVNAAPAVTPAQNTIPNSNQNKRMPKKRRG